jgi:hypothetical protein
MKKKEVTYSFSVVAVVAFHSWSERLHLSAQEVDLAFGEVVAMGNHDHSMLPILYWFAEGVQGLLVEVDGEGVVVVQFLQEMATQEPFEEVEEAFQEETLWEKPVGESVLAGMAGTGRDSAGGFTGEPVRAGIGGVGRDRGAGGLPARMGGGGLRGGGGGVDESSAVLSSRQAGLGEG